MPEIRVVGHCAAPSGVTGRETPENNKHETATIIGPHDRRLDCQTMGQITR